MGGGLLMTRGGKKSCRRANKQIECNIFTIVRKFQRAVELERVGEKLKLATESFYLSKCDVCLERVAWRGKGISDNGKSHKKRSHATRDSQPLFGEAEKPFSFLNNVIIIFFQTNFLAGRKGPSKWMLMRIALQTNISNTQSTHKRLTICTFGP